MSPTKWCHRKLSDKELLLSKDIPQDALECLGTDNYKELVKNTISLSGKCCIALLDDLSSAPGSVKRHKADDGSTLVIMLGIPGAANGGEPEAELSLDQRLEVEQEQKNIQGAVKADDALVPMHLWDTRLLPKLPQEQHSQILNPICSVALQWWRYNTLRTFLNWFKQVHAHLFNQ